MGLHARLNKKEASEQTPRGEGVSNAQRQEVSNVHASVSQSFTLKGFEVPSCTATEPTRSRFRASVPFRAAPPDCILPNQENFTTAQR